MSHASDPHDLERPRQTPFPTTGRLAGIDFGTVRIGVAYCDVARTLASPGENYTRRSERLDGQFFAQLAREERLVGFVVGLPLHMNGDDSPKCVEARAFGAWLTEITGLPVVYHDERLSSTLAEDALREAGLSKGKRKARLDKLAAQFILTGWLERQERENSSPPG